MPSPCASPSEDSDSFCSTTGDATSSAQELLPGVKEEDPASRGFVPMRSAREAAGLGVSAIIDVCSSFDGDVERLSRVEVSSVVECDVRLQEYL